MAQLAAVGLVFGAGMLGGRYVLNRISEVQETEANAQRVVFVLGGPGSGKGTNCAKLVKEFGYTHLSAGDLLRAERASGSQLGEEINALINKGELVSSTVTVGLIKTAMEKSEAKHFLIDGFPRNAENLEVWNQEMAHVIVDFVLTLECSDEIMQQRLITRGQQTGRTDDNIQAIQTRLKIYHERTQPIIQQFKALNKVHFVSAEASVDEVYAKLRVLFKPQGMKYSFYDGKAARKPNEDLSNLMGGAADDDDVEADPTMFSLYEADDGFRGTYEEVVAHEAELERKKVEEENKQVNLV